MDVYKVKLTFTEPVLGTVPKSKEVYKNHVQDQAIRKARKMGVELTEEMLQQELDSVMNGANEEKGWTGFHVNPDGLPSIYDYAIKGFFKEACSSLRQIPKSRSSKLTAYKKKVDGLVFAQPRLIPLIVPDGQELDWLERPLRAQTAQGERVALAISDTAPIGTRMEFEVKILGVIKEDLLRDWLDYGALKGLGQWRSGGYGSFEYEIVV